MNKIHELNFKNGFKLIFKEDHRSPIAILQIFYKVGSSYEHNGITGISHVLEHMMFRGTHNYSSRTFLHKISELGGKLNAYTTRDFTTYYEILQADDLYYGFKFEADRMTNLLLHPNSFSKEMQVVMEERLLTVEDDPELRVLESFYAVALLANPRRHPVIGWMNDLENLSISDVEEWYKKWYSPNNAIGVVVGDLNAEQVLELADKYFGPLKPSVITNVKPQNELSLAGTRTLVVKAQSKLPLLILGFNTPVIRMAKTPWEPYGLIILCELLAGGASSRLYKNLVRGKRLAIEIDYIYSPFDRTNNVLTILITPAHNIHLEELQLNIFDQIIKLENEITQSELKRVKAQIISNKTYQEDSIIHQAHEIGSFEAVGLSWRAVGKSYKEIMKITVEQIKRVAMKYLNADNLTIGKLQPLPVENKPNLKFKHHFMHKHE